MSDPTGNGWDQYKLLILEQLKQIGQKQDQHSEDITTIKTDIALMKEAREQHKWLGGFLIPASLGLAASWIGRKLGL